MATGVSSTGQLRNSDSWKHPRTVQADSPGWACLKATSQHRQLAPAVTFPAPGPLQTADQQEVGLAAAAKGMPSGRRALLHPLSGNSSQKAEPKRSPARTHTDLHILAKSVGVMGGPRPLTQALCLQVASGSHVGIRIIAGRFSVPVPTWLCTALGLAREETLPTAKKNHQIL